ncbi:MAG: UDP-N-acetylmuramate dehydrogenase [Caldimicrobium sp.]|jgi:UDP-N-acetylmuramate dehydrogenase
MKWLKALDWFLREKRIFYKEEELLSPHTTIKIGGQALRTVYPKEIKEFISLLDYLNKEEIPFYVIGGGSNLLVNDKGYQGVVVFTKFMKGIEIFKENEVLRLKILAGTKINEIIRVGYERGFGGFEFLAGVPATLGGAIRMNAGAFGKSTSLLVKKVTLYQEGEVKEIEPKENDWTYRAFKIEGIILSAELELIKAEKEEIRKNLQQVWEKRRATQPISEKTFGSVFKNPPCCYAGALIERVGLKGYQIGKAKISEKHANFIINMNGAKTEEVLSLMRLARKKVYENFNILLEPEVKFLGIEDGCLD